VRGGCPVSTSIPEPNPEPYASAEEAVRDFARMYPTPSVLGAVRSAERGELTWEEVLGVFARAALGALLVEEARQ